MLNFSLLCFHLKLNLLLCQFLYIIFNFSLLWIFAIFQSLCLPLKFHFIFIVKFLTSCLISHYVDFFHNPKAIISFAFFSNLNAFRDVKFFTSCLIFQYFDFSLRSKGYYSLCFHFKFKFFCYVKFFTSCLIFSYFDISLRSEGYSLCFFKLNFLVMLNFLHHI